MENIMQGRAGQGRRLRQALRARPKAVPPYRHAPCCASRSPSWQKERAAREAALSMKQGVEHPLELTILFSGGVRPGGMAVREVGVEATEEAGRTLRIGAIDLRRPDAALGLEAGTRGAIRKVAT